MPTPSEDYRLIPLTRGQFAKVSPHRFDELSQFKWTAHWSPGMRAYYVRRFVGIEGTNRIYVWMHRQILGLNRGDTRRGDHINHDGLDNRDENLRIASCSENSHNVVRCVNNTSGFKGVGLHNGKYRARIQIKGKSVFLGHAKTAEGAFRLYEEAAIRLHGEFACFDDIPEVRKVVSDDRR